MSITNVNITFGWGQSSLAYRYNSNNCLQLGPVQWVDAGDISELVAGSPSICVQRQNKGTVSEIVYSTCFFADKEVLDGEYLSTNKISGTGMSSCGFSTYMFYDSSFTIYSDTYSNWNILQIH